MKRVFLLALGTLGSFAACSSSSNGGGGNADGGLPDGSLGDASSADGGSGMDSGNGDSGMAPNGLAWTSGTRLRAVVAVADTAHIFAFWHDKQLDVDCMYGLASDATVRCLPINGGAAYDDAACSNPVAAVASPYVAQVKYVPDPYGPFACGKGSDFYALGAQYVPAAIYTKGEDGSCNAGFVDPNVTYSHLGAKVLPSVFVAEKDVIDPRGTKVSAIQWVGTDSSRQDGMLIDLGRNSAPCGPQANKAGSYFCVPSRTAYQEGQFVDGACSMAAAFYPTAQQATCAKPPTAILDSTGKATDLTFFEPGPKVTTQLHQGSPASCQPYTKPAGVFGDFYATGSALPLSLLPPLTIKEQGTGRIQQHTLVTDKGGLATILDFYDSGKSTVCREGKGTDGVARCMPVLDKAVFNDINDFLDAACTQPVFQRYVTNPAPTLGGWAHASTPTLNQIAIVSLGAKLATPGAVWTLAGAACNAGVVDGTAEYYATTIVPPTDFVPITRVVE
jgi:hypothetical protein